MLSFPTPFGFHETSSDYSRKADIMFTLNFCCLQLWSIYAAGNTVPIPFLRATDISPIALLSDNVLGGLQQDTTGTATVEALQELFSGDGQSKRGRRGQIEVPPPPFSLSLGKCSCAHVAHVHVSITAFYIGILFDMQHMSVPPSIYQRLTSSSTLLNLAQALAYHKMYALFLNLYLHIAIVCLFM